MKRDKAWKASAIFITVAGLLVAGWFLARDAASPDADAPLAVNVKVQLEGFRDYAHLVMNPDGSHAYRLYGFDGTVRTLTPEAFATQVYRQQRSRNLLEVIFNISSPMGIVWVSVGFLGQVLFTGRMVVQWLVSEKQHRSVVPPMFWWMSLLGALMLLAYFLWRRDAVGVLGQSVGLGIYVRNLHLIYIARRSMRAA